VELRIRNEILKRKKRRTAQKNKRRKGKEE